MGMTGRVGVTIVAVASAAGMGLQGAPAFAATTVTKYATTTTNVRSGASTSYGLVGSLTVGTAVTGDLQANGWIKIATPTTYAGRYVSGAVLSSAAPAASPSAAPSTATVTMPSSGAVTGYVAAGDHQVNVRSGPGFTYPVVSHLAPSTMTTATRVAGTVSGDWVHTDAGYVNKGTLVPVAKPFSVNARMPIDQLCAIPLAYNSPMSFKPFYTPKVTRYLNCVALQSFLALENAYRAATGHVAPIDLAYRDAADQQYWVNLYLSGQGHYAKPVGQSPHGWGLAVDFLEADGSTEFTYTGSGFAWLKANALKYGFTANPGHVDGESFHWNFSG